MFSHTETESRLAFVEGIGQYEKNYVDEDEYATAQDERQRIVFVILYMAAVIFQMMPLESKLSQFSVMIMAQWRGYVAYEFSNRCLESLEKNRDVVEQLAANIGCYGADSFFVSSQINELMRQNNDEDYLHGFEPEPQRALEMPKSLTDTSLMRTPSPHIAAMPMNEPTSIISGKMRCSAPCSL